MTEYEAELQAEMTTEGLYQEWEQALLEEDTETAVALLNELTDRGVNMEPYVQSLPRHAKALILSYV